MNFPPTVTPEADTDGTLTVGHGFIYSRPESQLYLQQAELI